MISEEWLRSHEYHDIGRGTHATVWWREGGATCLKITYRWDPWPLWIWLAAQDGGLGLYAPMVSRIKGYKNGYAAVMEYIPHDLYYEDTRCIEHAIRYGSYHPNPIWVARVRRIFNFMLERGACSDLSPNNFRQRANGDIVLTDPVSGKVSERDLLRSSVIEWRRNCLRQYAASPFCSAMR